MELYHKKKFLERIADIKCIYGPYHFGKKVFIAEQIFLIKEITKFIPVNYDSFFKDKLDHEIEVDLRNYNVDLRNYNIYKCKLVEPTFLEAINSEVEQIMILTKDELFNEKIYHYGIIYYKGLGIRLPSLIYFFLHLGTIKDMPITINVYRKPLESDGGLKFKIEYAKELLEKIKYAPEISVNAIEIYDAILIEPLHEDSWDSGYKTLNFYGYLKDLKVDYGFIIHKIGSRDCLNILSYFKKLKRFEISIDIPFYTNIIRIYCKNHLIQVTNKEFKFIKK